MIELISVHIPKCAGKSFSTVLKQVYGVGLVIDHHDQPLDPERPFQKDFGAWKARQAQQPAPGARAIHGHFWAGKYDRHAADATRIIWVRDPIKRLVSHYYFWKSIPVMPHSLHELLHANQLSLLEFAQLPAMQNILRGTFLRDRTLNEFDFVGIQEHFAEDLQGLTQRMKWKKQKVPKQNQTVHEGYGPKAIDAVTEKKLRALNEADLQMYDAALQLRARRLSASSVWVRFSRALKPASCRP